MKKIPKFICLNLMYRDASNYKTFNDYWYSNDKEFSQEDLNKYLNQLMDNPFIAGYYDLANLAPMDNEFMASYGDDHSFVELNGFVFEYEERTPYGSPIIPEDDIYECIRTIMNPDVLKEKQEAARLEAIAQLNNNLKSIGG